MRFYNVKSVADAQRKEELEKDKIYLSSNEKNPSNFTDDIPNKTVNIDNVINNVT